MTRKKQSPAKRFEVLLHPVRFRVLQVLAPRRDEGMTPAEIGAALRDVPVATLYRQLAALERAGFIVAASTRRVRGAIEKRYVAGRSTLSADDVKDIDEDAYLALFSQHIGALLDNLARHLQTGAVPCAAAGYGFRTTALWLTDRELRELREEVDATVRRRVGNQPRRGRRPRTLTTMLLPWVPLG